MYKAKIYYQTELDDYNNGLIGGITNDWFEVLEAKTPEKLRTILLETLPVNWEDINREDINEYEHASEYWASWLVNNDNFEASDQELKAWKQGKTELWNCDAHILISKVNETKATL